MEMYGIVFNKIYSGDCVIMYEAVDVKKVIYDADSDCYYDSLENEYIMYDDDDVAIAPANTKFIGLIKTLEEMKKEVPELIQDKDILPAYLAEKSEYLYLGKLINNGEDEDETEIEIIPLNIDFLTTLGDGQKIFECMSGSISPSGKVTYTLEERIIDKLLKINSKKELREELQKIKSLGTVELPDQDIVREVTIIDEPIQKIKEVKKTETNEINSVELYDILTKRIINQESAIKDIVSTLAIDQYSTCTAERTRCLLVGPTGCGKSEIIRTIANYLDKPFVHIDSTQLTQAGYVGADIEDFLMNLVTKAKGDIKKAENGIIVLDEIDKKGSASNGDISGRGVLNMLLPLLDGTEYTLKDNIYSKPRIFNTSNLTIFAAGAFTDVIKGKTKADKSIGFSGQNVKIKSTLDFKPEDFIKYGMMTDEFMGRFQVISELNALDIKTLEEILLTSTASPLRAENNKLKKLGVKLTYEDGYIHAVADQAILLKTGARSLKTIIEKSIKEARFEVIMNPGKYSSIKLLEQTVKDPKIYKLYKKKGR